MMDKVVFFPSAVLGLSLVAIYCIRSWRADLDINVGIIINILLSAAGVVAGVVIAASTLYEPLRQSVADLNFYILISGMAVIAVSVQSLAKDFGVKRHGATRTGAPSAIVRDATPAVADTLREVS